MLGSIPARAKIFCSSGRNFKWNQTHKNETESEIKPKAKSNRKRNQTESEIKPTKTHKAYKNYVQKNKIRRNENFIPNFNVFLILKFTRIACIDLFFEFLSLNYKKTYIVWNN